VTGASSRLRREIATGLRDTVTTRRLRLILAVSVIADLACLAPYFVLLPDLVKSHHDRVGMPGLAY
jgi:hypothetical protein